ncbi:MAG: WD40 repeat domain-containing protein [Planctomycetes bacterium]|jgi:hypothetical protein|nr:WD40 repeat domain-containing protein [Planctomycetota bacterium]
MTDRHPSAPHSTATWVTASPDGASLGIGRADGAFLRWQLDQPTAVPWFHAGDFVARAAWFVDGQLVLGCRNGRIELRDVAGELRAQFDSGHGVLRGLAVDAAAARFATAGDDGAVRTWSLATGRRELELVDGAVAATAVAFARGAIVGGYRDGCFVAWDRDGREVLASGRLLGSTLACLVARPDGGSLLAGGARGGLAELLVGPAGAWRAGTGWREPPRDIAVNAIDVAADGQFVVAASDGVARRYGPRRGPGELLGQPFWLRSPRPEWGAEFIVSGACFAGAATGRELVATAHFDGAVRLWRGTECIARVDVGQTSTR